jgi:hypothetical protein
VHVVGLSVELGKLGFEVRAHLPHQLFEPGEVAIGEYLVPVLGQENQMRMKHEAAVPTSTNIPVIRGR